MKNNPDDNKSESAGDLPQKPKREKVSIDPAQRGPGGFNRAQLKGKAPIKRKPKKAGR